MKSRVPSEPAAAVPDPAVVGGAAADDDELDELEEPDFELELQASSTAGPATPRAAKPPSVRPPCRRNDLRSIEYAT
jgi:hypothetical protein